MKELRNEIYDLLENHLNRYPKMQLQDMVKLLYQNEFGPGHMIEREEKSLSLLKSELHSISSSSNEEQCIDIGNGLVRIDLKDMASNLLPPLNRLFVRTANSHKGSIVCFLDKLQLLAEYLGEKNIYPPDSVALFLEEYKEKLYPALSHSEEYRTSYAPAYRVIKGSYIPYLTVFERILHLMRSGIPVTVCIEGNCASGKTSLAGFLSDFIDCNVIHMDDFFLPPALRTQERLAEPGGNVHYERFYEEVISPLLSEKPVCFRRFSCRIMDYQDTVTLAFKPLTIIEGSYCMREEFRKAYDYRVFFACTPEEQLSRIRNRNGEEMLSAFTQKWIPMENKYFDTLDIRSHCDIVI